MTIVATAAALSLPISLCRSSNLNTKKGVRGRFRVVAVFREEGGLEKKSTWGQLFDVEDPRSKVPQCKGKFLDVNQALEVARYDLQYCDWRARQDVLTIMLLHEKVVEVLNPLARDYKSIGTMKKELAELQGELAQAHKQVHMSEARVATALDKLAYMEELVNDRLLQDRSTIASDQTSPSPSTSKQSLEVVQRRSPRKSLNVSGPVKPYHPRLKNFWYPVAFSNDLKEDTMIPIECFEEPWVLFRGKDGKPGCIQNTCAHRACPLHLGSVNEGRIQCPYHGWEYSTDGKCEKMPSTRLLNLKIKSLPCFEQEGMIWIWPGNDPPTATIPSLEPPPGFQIHAEIVMELPVEHGLLLDNLLDLAHAPFTHTSTFAKGWSVPSFVKFLQEANRVQIDYTKPIQKDEKKETPTADGDSQIGTVGCVAVDSHGNLASATSTGGFVNKMVGRIGDTPIIGAGTYANNLCAVSATGKGEAVMRATVARDVAALMEFKGLSLKEAAAYVIEESVPRGNAGLVAVSAKGEVTMALNTTGMYRACATEDGYSEIGIWPSVQN